MDILFGIPEEWMERYEEAVDEFSVQDWISHCLAFKEIQDRMQIEDFFGYDFAKEAESELCLDEDRIRFKFDVPFNQLDD